MIQNKPANIINTTLSFGNKKNDLFYTLLLLLLFCVLSMFCDNTQMIYIQQGNTHYSCMT